MQFTEIKQLEDVPVWVREHLAEGESALNLLRDVELSFAHLIDAAARREIGLELKDPGEATHTQTNEKVYVQELHVSIPEVGIYSVRFILTLEGRITNMIVREIGMPKKPQGSIRLQGFAQIKDLPDVVEWIASDGINPDASVEFIDVFDEHAERFLKGMSRRDKLQIRLGFAPDLLRPEVDLYRVVQLGLHNSQRATMVVFTMLNGRIKAIQPMSEIEFKNFPSVPLDGWRYLQ